MLVVNGSKCCRTDARGSCSWTGASVPFGVKAMTLAGMGILDGRLVSSDLLDVVLTDAGIMVGKPSEMLDCVRLREYGEVRSDKCGCCCCSLTDIVRFDLLAYPEEVNHSMIVHGLLMR